jgi:polyadenylation factor subunit 2
LSASGNVSVQIKLWDARSGTHVSTYHGHQDRVNCVKFHWNGNWLLSGSKDTTCKLFELRMNRELQRFIGHKKEVNTVAWHPCQESVFVSGVLQMLPNIRLVLLTVER